MPYKLLVAVLWRPKSVSVIIAGPFPGKLQRGHEELVGPAQRFAPATPGQPQSWPLLHRRLGQCMTQRKHSWKL